MEGNGRMEQLSVIIPVYNNKRYFAKCIDSVRNQEYQDIEIILVDDGSTDGSGGLCDEYQKADHRIQVIHKENEGCMSARRDGLRRSKGRYIGFVDSDDWIASDMYKKLMSAAGEKNCDIVSMSYTAVFDEQKEIRADDDTLFGHYERGKNLDIFLSNMMYDAKRMKRGAQPSLCTKIIKRELLIKVFDKTDQRITMGEDAAIFYPCCLEMKNICIMKDYRYFYRVHDRSMCRNRNPNIFNEYYSFYQYMQNCFLKYGNQYGLSEQLRQYVWTFLEEGVNQVFHIKVRRTYLFPYTAIERGSDIILYGAGAVGLSYYAQISDNHYCNIVIWADKRNNSEKIVHPHQIEKVSNMKILIAIKKKETADEIIDELTSSGIRKERLVWICPQEIPVI